MVSISSCDKLLPDNSKLMVTYDQKLEPFLTYHRWNLKEHSSVYFHYKMFLIFIMWKSLKIIYGFKWWGIVSLWDNMCKWVDDYDWNIIHSSCKTQFAENHIIDLLSRNEQPDSGCIIVVPRCSPMLIKMDWSNLNMLIIKSSWDIFALTAVFHYCEMEKIIKVIM